MKVTMYALVFCLIFSFGYCEIPRKEGITLKDGSISIPIDEQTYETLKLCFQEKSLNMPPWIAKKNNIKKNCKGSGSLPLNPECYKPKGSKR